MNLVSLPDTQVGRKKEDFFAGPAAGYWGKAD